MTASTATPGRLAGKVAIVTGGGSGFGEGIVHKFVAEGARVLVADINEQAAQRVAVACGSAAVGLRVDVANAADVRRMMDAAEQHFGGIHILINNAGVTHLPQPLQDVSEDDFDRIVAVNMKAIYLAMREVVPRLLANAPGVKGVRGCGAEHGQHGRREPAPAPGLVQRQQGLGHHRHSGQCGGTGAAGHTRGGAQPGGG
jgi:NAD(P)-dependent dehydrogenase (short-subunit alcohol dehydrogenase family)